MKTIKLILNINLTYLLLNWLSGAELKAQNIGINGTGTTAHPSALLDVDAVSTPSLGILIPRIALQAINVSAPVNSPAASLLVYNTASASTGTNAVTTGYYYWDGVKWVRFAYNQSGNSANDWSTLGNVGTVDGTNFIGTTDNIPFNIRVNNQKAGRIENTGQNTSYGYQALNSNTTGIGSTAIGWQALFNNNQSSSTAVGRRALYTNTIGDNNSAFGYNALLSNTTGSNNIAVGNNALQNNTIAENNTAIGVSALFSNTTGDHNTAIGRSVLNQNTTGTLNTGMGHVALQNNTTGSYNVATGYRSLWSNTTGEDNTACGRSSLKNNISGFYNTAIGSTALDTNQTGNYNVAIGKSSLGNNVSGSFNTAVGAVSALSNSVVLNGSYNTYLGAFTDALGTYTNATAIGYNAKGRCK